MNNSQLISLLYHDFFDYPLTKSELKKWQAGKHLKLKPSNIKISNSHGLYYLGNRKNLIKLRRTRKQHSQPKLALAQKTAHVLSKIPTIYFVGITGSLAMDNSSHCSDIDLLVITQASTLWTTRLFTYLLLRLLHFDLRKPGSKSQKDKLCFNLWLDASDLKFSNQNLYTAHEIAQIKPLVNKHQSYQQLLSQNKWILDYWPNAVKIRPPRSRSGPKFPSVFYIVLTTILELPSRWFQYQYMKSKITTETVTPTRAMFHQKDWSTILASKLDKYLTP